MNQPTYGELKAFWQDRGRALPSQSTPAAATDNQIVAHRSMPVRYANVKDAELGLAIGSKYAIVFAGFSGLEYAAADRVDTHVRAILDEKIAQYGKDNLVAVAGATEEGIGRIYAIAKSLGIATLGIVSTEAEKWDVPISPYCDKVIYVPDPKGTWEVNAEDGESYTVKAAWISRMRGGLGGCLVLLGGGDVAVTELKQAWAKKIPTQVFGDYDPDPEKARAKQEKENAKALREGREPKVFDHTPVRTLLKSLGKTSGAM